MHNAKICDLIIEGLYKARQKHPVFAENSQHALSVIEYEAIKTPPCSKCKSRPDFKKSDCGTHRCDEIYQEEVNAVMAIIEKELNL